MTTEQLAKKFIDAGLPVRPARMLAQRFAFLHDLVEKQNLVIEELRNERSE
jgi:hypothetical protein